MTLLLRRLLTLAAGLSLLLCVATVVLWVRSWFVTDVIIRDRRGASTITATPPGAIRYTRFAIGGEYAVGTNYEALSPADFKLRFGFLYPGLSSRAGFGYARDEFVTSRRRVRLHIQIPFWSLAILTAALPLVRLRIHLRHHTAARRQAAGRCTACGYDLRATPGRCPECGTEAGNVGS